MRTALSSVHERIRLAPFEFRPSYDIMSLFPKTADSLISQIAALHWRPEGEDAYESFAPLVVSAPLAVPTSLFDSQLATIVYQTIGVLPSSIEARAVLPAVLIGRSNMSHSNSAVVTQTDALFSDLLFACPILVGESKSVDSDGSLEQSIELQVDEDVSALSEARREPEQSSLLHGPLAAEEQSIELANLSSSVKLGPNPLFGIDQSSAAATSDKNLALSVDARMECRPQNERAVPLAPTAVIEIPQPNLGPEVDDCSRLPSDMRKDVDAVSGESAVAQIAVGEPRLSSRAVASSSDIHFAAFKLLDASHSNHLESNIVGSMHSTLQVPPPEPQQEEQRQKTEHHASSRPLILLNGSPSSAMAAIHDELRAQEKPSDIPCSDEINKQQNSVAIESTAVAVAAKGTSAQLPEQHGEVPTAKPVRVVLQRAPPPPPHLPRATSSAPFSVSHGSQIAIRGKLDAVPSNHELNVAANTRTTWLASSPQQLKTENETPSRPELSSSAHSQHAELPQPVRPALLQRAPPPPPRRALSALPGSGDRQ